MKLMRDEIVISESWDVVLDMKLVEKAVEKIMTKRFSGINIVPEQNKVFNALRQTPFENVKVLIIGQDPYPNPQKACGLAFSYPSGCEINKKDSLTYIFDEIKRDIGVDNRCGNLQPWASQGVLLLNTALTYESKKKMSEHVKIWKELFNKIVLELIKRDKQLVVMLWGNNASLAWESAIGKKILNKNIKVLKSSHPSGQGYWRKGPNGSFLNCKHFSMCDNFLGSEKINWQT